MGLMEYIYIHIYIYTYIYIHIYIYRTSLTGDSKPTNILLRLTRLIVGSRYRLTEMISGVSVMVKFVAQSMAGNHQPIFIGIHYVPVVVLGFPISGMEDLIFGTCTSIPSGELT